jgi:hypothetical protein
MKTAGALSAILLIRVHPRSSLFHFIVAVFVPPFDKLRAGGLGG